LVGGLPSGLKRGAGNPSRNAVKYQMVPKTTEIAETAFVDINLWQINAGKKASTTRQFTGLTHE
jgi:hypothetical protein